MKAVNGLKVSVCQMSVVPGRPDLNTENILHEMKIAEESGVDIIAFPEMAVSGYLIGDLYEDEAFVKDIVNFNEQIVNASGKTAVIFGSLTIEEDKKGEDGRIRKQNSAIIAQNGRLIGVAIKSLQPNYRMFDDDRHLLSLRKNIDEECALGADINLKDRQKPLEIETRIGKLNVGVILCEDMWHMDYPHNPTENMFENGAEIIFNLSASPWTWQKNRKRHQVVNNLIKTAKIPFVYVNNAGIQNNGKNIVVFDGSSTIYNDKGERIFSIEPYFTGSKSFKFGQDNKVLSDENRVDIEELYLALTNAIRGFMELLPESMRKVVIGLSGGIDSALTTALYTDVLGSNNVITINMPSKFNSQGTKDIAEAIATNLNVQYLVVPIQEIVDVVAEKTGAEVGTVTHENIQARTRMEILAAKAQKEGCVFSANWNKIEAAFGYGTLYGDMGGFLAVLGDLTKYEVYQLAKYMNEKVFKKEAIPSACFIQAPSAELSTNQKDPFDYGKLDERGYHDEMVRAFTEFRKNPEWFIEEYISGELEKALNLKSGKLDEIFPTAEDFVKDLEKNWERFGRAYFKRVQGPPVPIVSKRAFGYDLRESIVPIYFTQRYNNFKFQLLEKTKVK